MKQGFFAPARKAQRSTYSLDAPTSEARQPGLEDDADPDHQDNIGEQPQYTSRGDPGHPITPPRASWQQCLDLLASDQDERK